MSVDVRRHQLRQRARQRTRQLSRPARLDAGSPLTAMDHGSFRNQLAFAIGFAVSRSRDVLHRLLKEHAPDDARDQLAERVVQHLEQSGFRG